FSEVFRFKADKGHLSSPPVALFNGHTAIATDDGRILLAGPNTATVPPVQGVQQAYAAPTRTADGRLVAVGSAGSVAVVRDNQLLFRTPSLGVSIASAAASRTHVFVATDSAFITFDANTMQQVQKFDWVGGGLWPPVIGPQGHVYAMASHI